MKILFIALIFMSSFAQALEKPSVPARTPAGVNKEKPEFKFETKLVDGGQVICGYASAPSYIYSNGGDLNLVHAPTASVSCVFVPTK